ncbi:hypothetical protein BY996DRAFT_6567515 [Phakopsora pachyrhizi]|nr:hypothetical protein BY996DRAFT_6567515 [Phakopsora pachyrhizi]
MFSDFSDPFDQPIPAERLVVELVRHLKRSEKLSLLDGSYSSGKSSDKDLKKKGKGSRMMIESSQRRRRGCWLNFNTSNLESALASWKHKSDSYKNGVKSSAVVLQGQGGDCDALECFCDF